MQDLLETPEVPVETDPLALLVGLTGPTKEPSDPAIARLFPVAYLDDQLAAEDFRRFTEPDLRNEKLDNLDLVLFLLDQPDAEIKLNSEQVKAWLRALNDLRLVLGTRIGIDDESINENLEDPGFHLYDYLTYLQGTLIDVL